MNKSMKSLPEITASDLLEEKNRRKYFKLKYFFPDKGPLRRELYIPHTEFIRNTKNFRENVFLAANRSGKSETGAYAVTTWLTGLYPEWWDGKRFERNVSVLVSGETGKLVRDSIQAKLLGEPSDIGSGMIPKHLIVATKPKSGIPDAVDTVRIKSAFGGESILQFQSYDQGRKAFQATERDVILEDEEPPIEIHNENLMRTMTTGGIVLLTFTPLKGLSDTVLSLQEKEGKSCHISRATWDDAPHLAQDEKDELFESLPPYQRDARSKGVPQLGSGAIFPVSEEDILVEPFEVPKSYKWSYGMDVGWKATAAVWLAHDLETDIVYVVSDYKRGQAEPSSHASAIKARGKLTGAIDPASCGRGQKDGEQLIQLYRGEGLDLVLADNTVEAGIFDIYQRLTTGRLKVFKTCQDLLKEYRIYRRDEKGLVVKKDDHLMDALRYGVRTGLSHGRYKDVEDSGPVPRNRLSGSGWMG